MDKGVLLGLGTMAWILVVLLFVMNVHFTFIIGGLAVIFLGTKALKVIRN